VKHPADLASVSSAFWRIECSREGEMQKDQSPKEILYLDD